MCASVQVLHKCLVTRTQPN